MRRWRWKLPVRVRAREIGAFVRCRMAGFNSHIRLPWDVDGRFPAHGCRPRASVRAGLMRSDAGRAVRPAIGFEKFCKGRRG